MATPGPAASPANQAFRFWQPAMMRIDTNAELADQTAAIEAMAGPPGGTVENRPPGLGLVG